MKHKLLILIAIFVLAWMTGYVTTPSNLGKTEPRSVIPVKITPVDSRPDEMALNDQIAQNSIDETICDGSGGWNTGMVRPSTAVTNKIKRKLMDESGTTLPSSAFQLDHLVPLTLGGHPTSTNLWLQPIAEAHKKDRYEKYLWGQVCEDKVHLREAQEMIFTNWEYYYLEAGLDKKVGNTEIIADQDDE